MIYVSDEYFEGENSSWEAACVLDRTVRLLEWVEFTDQDHITMNHRGCGTIKQFQMNLSTLPPKLKKTISLNVACLIIIIIFFFF